MQWDCRVWLCGSVKQDCLPLAWGGGEGGNNNLECCMKYTPQWWCDSQHKKQLPRLHSMQVSLKPWILQAWRFCGCWLLSVDCRAILWSCSRVLMFTYPAHFVVVSTALAAPAIGPQFHDSVLLELIPSTERTCPRHLEWVHSVNEHSQGHFVCHFPYCSLVGCKSGRFVTTITWSTVEPCKMDTNWTWDHIIIECSPQYTLSV